MLRPRILELALGRLEHLSLVTLKRRPDDRDVLGREPREDRLVDRRAVELCHDCLEPFTERVRARALELERFECLPPPLGARDRLAVHDAKIIEACGHRYARPRSYWPSRAQLKLRCRSSASVCRRSGRSSATPTA